jgi:hypothetical protein
MRVFACTLTLISLLAFTSCGGGGGSSTGGGSNGGPQNSSLTSGNWSIVATSTFTMGTSYLGGSLTQSGSNLSAVLHIDGSSCYDISTDVPLNGSISGTNFTLTSAAVNSQVISVAGTVSSASALQGTYSIAGGCSAGDHGNIAAVIVPSISGTWKAVDNSSGTPVTITGTITQSATPTVDGIFPLTGNFTYAGSPCSTGGTLNAVSFIAGDLVGIDAQTNDTNATTGETILVAYLDSPSAPTSFAGDYQIASGLCAGETGNLNFVKQ